MYLLDSVVYSFQSWHSCQSSKLAAALILEGGFDVVLIPLCRSMGKRAATNKLILSGVIVMLVTLLAIQLFHFEGGH